MLAVVSVIDEGGEGEGHDGKKLGMAYVPQGIAMVSM